MRYIIKFKLPVPHAKKSYFKRLGFAREKRKELGGIIRTF